MRTCIATFVKLKLKALTYGCPCKLHHTCLYLANVRQMVPPERQTSASSSFIDREVQYFSFCLRISSVIKSRFEMNHLRMRTSTRVIGRHGSRHSKLVTYAHIYRVSQRNGANGPSYLIANILKTP